MKEKTNYKIYNIFFIIIFLVMFINKVYDGDTYFHIKIGEEIIKNGFLKYDIFSMHSGLKYISYAYLFDVIIYLFYRVFGLFGIFIFKYIITVSIFYIYYKLIYFINKNKTLSLLISGTIISIIGGVIVARPHVMSYLFLIIQIYIVVKYFENKKNNIIYFLPITFLILGNLHSGVIPFHVVILSIFVINYFNINERKVSIDKAAIKYILILIISVLVSFINPYFPDNILYAFKTIIDLNMMQVQEWKSATLNSEFGMLIFVLSIISFKIYNIKKIPITYFIIFIVILLVSINSVRFFPYLLIIFGLILAYNYKDYLLIYKDIFYIKSINKKILVFAIICIIMLIITKVSDDRNYLFENSKNGNPKDAVEYLKDNKINKVFNEYNYGSYLIFYDIKPFIDSRCDLYSSNYNNTSVLKDFLDVYYLKESPFKIFKKHNIKHALIKKDSTYYNVSIKPYIKKYKILYEDNNYIIILIISY